jgi:hypothetical protein
VYGPLPIDKQVPQNGRAYRPLLTPQLHRGQIERAFTAIQQFPGRGLSPHLFF